MNDLSIISTVDIRDNLDDLVTTIKDEIEFRFNVVVTDDNVAESKKMMAELNKISAKFKADYKDAKAKLLAPITKLDERAEQVLKFYSDAREGIKLQVEKFDQKRLDQIKYLVADYMDSKGYHVANFDVSKTTSKLTSLSEGKLSKTALQEIDGLIFTYENDRRNERLEADRLAHEKKLKDIEYELKVQAEVARRTEENLHKTIEKQIDKQANAKTGVPAQQEPISNITAGSIAFIQVQQETHSRKYQTPMGDLNILVRSDFSPIFTDDTITIGSAVIEFWPDFKIELIKE